MWTIVDKFMQPIPSSTGAIIVVDEIIDGRTSNADPVIYTATSGFIVVDDVIDGRSAGNGDGLTLKGFSLKVYPGDTIESTHANPLPFAPATISFPALVGKVSGGSFIVEDQVIY